MTTGYRNLATVCLAAVLAFGLAACGGGGTTKSAAELEAERLAAELEAAEMACTDAGGRWNDDDSCTSAAELVAEAAEMACTSAGGRYESDGSCTSAADVAAEQLAAAEMACTGAGGRWNDDDSCTSAAELVAEAAQMACEGAGGRYESDGSCTSAADLAAEMEMERVAGLRTACESAGGRFNADESCTTAAELDMEARMTCEGAGGRYESDGSCTSAADLAQMEMERVAGLRMACEDAGGRFNADESCTSAAELVAEAAQTNCEAGGGRYESDGSCTSAAELAEMACTDAGGRYESDGSCTSAADVAEMACTDADGRYESDGTCTSAAELAASKVAVTKKAAIATEADSTTTAARPFDLATPPVDADAPTATENYVLTVKHTGSAVEVTVADGALPADNDPMYEQAATFGDGQMLVRNIGTDRKIIVVHSDIEVDDQEAFSSIYTLTVDRDTDTTANDTYAVLDTDNGKIASSRFPSGASTQRTYVQYDADTTTGRASQFSGTFDGADGTFRCVASGGCTVSTDAMGDFNALTANEWEFTPDRGATVDVADSDYLTYGFWLDTTTKDGEIASYDTVQTFARSSLPDATGALGDVEGTATYEGGAAGVYVHEAKNDDGTVNLATSGRFTADVSLKAYFDSSTLRNENTIEGTISNFDLDGGPANSWNVNVSAGITSDFALENGVASGMTGDDGSLSGQFHSPADRVAADAPGVLVGEFNSNFVNGTAAGAFGAREKD